MRILLGATAVLMLMAAPAVAQTTLPSQCNFTAPPAVPDGARATNQQMSEARDALQAWRDTRTAELAACNTAARALSAQAQAAADAHNAGDAEAQAVIARFTEENQEYSARGSTSGRRERGSITN